MGDFLDRNTPSSFRQAGHGFACVTAPCAAALSCLGCGRATARQLPFGQWVAFNAGLAGSFDAQGLFKFSSQKRVVLRVTDAFCRGDRYRVLDHGHRIGTTSNVPIDTTCSELPFASTGPEGWHAPGYSRIRLVLRPGFHRIRIRSMRSPFGPSTGFLYIYRLG